MPDPIFPADTPGDDDVMPQGEARTRAEEELDALKPGPADLPHFAPTGDAEQQIDEPMHDMLGRRDGP